MSVYSGRFLTTTSHGQTLESRPGKAGGLPYVLVRVVFRGAESSSLGPYYEGLLPLLFREHNTRLKDILPTDNISCFLPDRKITLNNRCGHSHRFSFPSSRVETPLPWEIPSEKRDVLPAPVASPFEPRFWLVRDASG